MKYINKLNEEMIELFFKESLPDCKVEKINKEEDNIVVTYKSVRINFGDVITKNLFLSDYEAQNKCFTNPITNKNWLIFMHKKFGDKYLIDMRMHFHKICRMEYIADMSKNITQHGKDNAIKKYYRYMKEIDSLITEVKNESCKDITK